MQYSARTDPSEPDFADLGPNSIPVDEQAADFLSSEVAQLAESYGQDFDSLNITREGSEDLWAFNWSARSFFDFDNLEPPVQASPPADGGFSKHRRDMSDATTMAQPLVSPGFNDASPVSPISRALHTPVRGGQERSFLDSPASLQIGDSPLLSPTYPSPHVYSAPPNQPSSVAEVCTPMQARRLSASSPRRRAPLSITEEYAFGFDMLPQTLSPGNTVDIKPKLPTTPLSTLEEAPRPITASPRKEKKKEGRRDGRKRIAKEQTDVLEQFYQQNPRPERDDRLRLASVTGLEQRTVQIWFQNRRAKTRAMEAAREADNARARGAAAAAAIAASNGFPQLGPPAPPQQPGPPNLRMPFPAQTQHGQSQHAHMQLQQIQSQHGQMQSSPQHSSSQHMQQPMQQSVHASQNGYVFGAYAHDAPPQVMPPPSVPQQPPPLKPDARQAYAFRGYPQSYSQRAQPMRTPYVPNPPPLLRSQSLPTCESSIRFNQDLDQCFQDRVPAKRADSVVSVQSMGPGLPASPINSIDGSYNFSPEIVTDTEHSPASASPVSWDHPWGRSQSSSSLSLGTEWSQPSIAPDVKRRRSMASGSYSSSRSDEYYAQRAGFGSESDISSSLAASAAQAVLKGRHRSNTQPMIRQRQPSIRLQLDESSSSAHLIVVPEPSASDSARVGYFDSSELAAKASLRVAANRTGAPPFNKSSETMF